MTHVLPRVAVIVAVVAALLAIPGTGLANHFCNQTINSAGTYNLPHDHTCPAGTAVTIGASNVTLNLRGHTIDGQGTASYGIEVNSGLINVVIRNGTIRNFATAGVRLQCGVVQPNPPSDNITLRGLNIIDSGTYGIDACKANNTRIFGGGVLRSGVIGIHTFISDSVSIHNMVVRDNPIGIEFSGGDDALVSDTTVDDFNGGGIAVDGDDADSDVTIENSLVRSGNGTGIDINQRSIAVIRGTTVFDVNGIGIRINCSPTGVLDNNLVRNAGGEAGVLVEEDPCSVFSATDAWIIQSNTVRNGSFAEGFRIDAGIDHQLIGNTARSNGLDGFLIGSAAAAELTSNISRGNGDDGFQFDTTAVELTGNASNHNTGYGYRTSGPVTDNGNTVGNRNGAGTCSSPSDLPNTSC